MIATWQKCHAGANRRFAGYLTHATHHDPAKYPFFSRIFWGMIVIRAIRIFAWIALGIGLSIVVWIISALGFCVSIITSGKSFFFDVHFDMLTNSIRRSP